MISGSLLSSNSIMWETPIELFNKYNEIFSFNTDVCAVESNTKCKDYYSPEIDGLKQDWYGVCWMNPPYGKEISKWIEKAYLESLKGVTTVALLPSRTDTKYFHNFIYKRPNVIISFLKGRLKFGDSINSAPFPSMIVLFKGIIKE